MFNRPFLFSLAAVCIAMVMPLALVLMMWHWPASRDMQFYATILKVFSGQFWSGDRYPRWLADMNNGLGSPVFVYYGALPFFVASLFQWMSGVDPYGFYRIIICMAIGLFVAGMNCRLWLGRCLSPPEAEKGAVLYVALLYLDVFLFSVYDMPMIWGGAMIPLALAGAQALAIRGRRGVPLLAGAYALLFLTHLPSLVAFGWVPLLYVPWLSTRGRRLQNFFLTLAAALLGAGLAAFYWLPVIANRPFIDYGHLVDRDYSYYRNFLEPRAVIGMLMVTLPLAGLFALLPPPMRRERMTVPVRFWLLVIAIILFMNVPLSAPLWHYITPLQALPFPCRLFLAALPGLALIHCLWLPAIRHARLYAAGCMLAAGIAIACNPNVDLRDFMESKDIMADAIDHNLGVDIFDTRWMSEAGIAMTQTIPPGLKDPVPGVFTSGTGTARVISQTSRSIRMATQVSSPEATLRLWRFYFPGWRVEDNDSSEYPMRPDHAQLSLTVPHGSHEIMLAQPWLAGEQAGYGITLASVALWLIGIIAAAKSILKKY